MIRIKKETNAVKAYLIYQPYETPDAGERRAQNAETKENEVR